MDFLAEPLSPLNWQVCSEFESTCPFYSFDWDLKVYQWFVVRDSCVGEDKGPERDVAAGFPIFGKDDFEEMGRHGNVGRTPDYFVGYTPFAIVRILPGEIKRTGDDPYGRVVVGQPATEILEMRPVISVEAISHLRAHVTEEERLIHRFLTPFGISCRDLVAPVIARPEIVQELCSEVRRNGSIFYEYRVPAISVVDGKGRGCDVFCYPPGVSIAAVEGGDRR